MKKIETEILIQASPSVVWNVLTDFEAYPKWNPFIKSLQGEKIVGRNLLATIQPPNSKPMTFKPVLLKFDQDKEFRWKGKLLIKGLFDGEHYFILEKLGVNETRFIHGELFSGILIPLLGNVFKNTELGFSKMNEEIKKICESKN